MQEQRCCCGVEASYAAAAGFDLPSIKAAADKVVLRPNAAQVLRRARQLRVPVHVLSVNWSTEFVGRALGIDDQSTYRYVMPMASTCL